MTDVPTYIAADSPFLTTDTRRDRWAIPYHFECLNARIDRLLGDHRNAIAGQRILDVGSHIGTFAYAAHTLGADFVEGIDVETKTVRRCRDLFAQHGVPETACRFSVEDAVAYLERLEENSFDTVFCFGMLYYSADPYRLLELMARVCRNTLLLDTFTAAYAAVQGKDALTVYPAVDDETLALPLSIVTLTQPEKRDYRLPQSFPYKGKQLCLLTLPTQALLEIWFRSLGMEYKRIDWSRHIQAPKSYRDLYTPEQKKSSHWADVYASGIRVSYRLQPNVTPVADRTLPDR